LPGGYGSGYYGGAWGSEAPFQPDLGYVSPNTGPTGGRTFVYIYGTNFRLPDFVGQQSVQVKFGTKLATNVRVLSTTKLSCLTPIYDAGAVSVTVTNLDASGNAIEGETDTLASAFTFFLPKLTAEYESDLSRCVRTLVLELRRQLLPNTSLMVHTDWAESGGTATYIAELPALVLIGPELVENRFYSLNEEEEYDLGGTPLHTFRRRKVPYTVDLFFNIVGISDNQLELTNLMANTQLFFHRNKYLIMDRDPSDSSKGTVRYEMEPLPNGDVKMSNVTNESNVRMFQGRFQVFGFDIEDLADMTNDLVVNEAKWAETINQDVRDFNP
jgi:hypothetical protein